MDVNTVDRRDLEMANRLLRERENENAHAMDNLRESQREQIDSMRAAQKENIDHIRADANESVDNERKHFDKAIESSSDSYKRSLEDERTDNYNRFGRLNSEVNRQLTRQKEISAKQLQQLSEVNDHEVKTMTDQHRASTDKLEKQFRGDTQEVQDKYEKTMHDRNLIAQEAMAKQAGNFRNEVDEQVRKDSNDLIRSKTQNDQLVKKLVEDSEVERQRLAASAKLREAQMNADKDYLQKDLLRKGGASVDELRERAEHSISQTIRDANAKNNQAKRAEAQRFSNFTEEYNAKLQNKDNEMRSAGAELAFQNKTERDRDALHNQLTEARHKQELYLASEAVNENNRLMADEMRTQYSQNLHDIDDKNRARFGAHALEMSKKMAEQQAQESGERALEAKAHEREVGMAQLKTRKEKQELVREYESRQALADEMREKQFSDAKTQLTTDMRAVRDQANHEITANNRDTRLKMFEKDQTLLNNINELDSERKMELESKDQLHADRIKRLTDNYNRTLLANKATFDDESQSIRYEDELHMTKARGDAEHEKRMQLMEMLNKSRAAMSTMDNRFNTLKDQYDDELAKTKAENDKALKETMKKARETVESERLSHQREMEMKDMQTKEKLRLQEEAFRDSIEKLKRSYELNLKKS